ncbi:anti-phage deoxyguanosine triphosphatase [uncultured Sphingomonas sp.]|uniref:anti-phage deoxyguanosine triphosphatase n=1 Tax=uncultured Sphingomonas sp. TaxID=158754 RepID=UPI0026015164|nr:anti-phage deoxyguanosine triphosphatase [uncultured Sphingomonas sp.]
MPWSDRRSGWRKHAGDARSDADIDYGRIIHSASFRRLQGKTQILNLGDSDFYRTRLTHSLEVAQIAGSVTRQLREDFAGQPAAEHLPTLAQIQAIGATHDLGHPPFGHGGEAALNYCMASSGGFEGNGQTIRILTRLEKYSDSDGADLARRTLLGTLKYPVSYRAVAHPERRPSLRAETSVLSLIDRESAKPPKCYMDSEHAAVMWILETLSESDRNLFTRFDTSEPAAQGLPEHHRTRHKSLDCSIMDVSDDIAFGVHDLEDALALALITREDFELYVPPDACGHFLDFVNSRKRSTSGNDAYGDLVAMLFGSAAPRKHAISRLVGYFVQHCVLEDESDFEEPLIRYRAAINPSAAVLLKALKKLVYKRVIRSPAVQHLEFKGQQMVVAVFEAFASEPEAFLPRGTFALFERDGGDIRVICDHIAGMTDSYLLKTYERLFSPRMGSVFDHL